MPHWLFKEEPDHYSLERLFRDKRTVWDGVENNLALKHLRSVQKGDRVLCYHTGKEKAVVGVMEVVKGPYRDPTRECSNPVVSRICSQRRDLSLRDSRGDKTKSCLTVGWRREVHPVPLQSRHGLAVRTSARSPSHPELALVAPSRPTIRPGRFCFQSKDPSETDSMMPVKKTQKKRSKPRVRLAKRVTAKKARAASTRESLQDNLATFAHWWKQGFRQIVFEVDQLARVKGMPHIDLRMQASPRVDVSIAHRNAISALRQLDRAGVANLEQEVRHELLWPVTGSFGGRIQTQEDLDRMVSRLRQFPDDSASWQKEIVDRMLEIRRLGHSYFEFLASKLRRHTDPRGSTRPSSPDAGSPASDRQTTRRRRKNS
jgi:hypothetical protein